MVDDDNVDRHLATYGLHIAFVCHSRQKLTTYNCQLNDPLLGLHAAGATMQDFHHLDSMPPDVVQHGISEHVANACQFSCNFKSHMTSQHPPGRNGKYAGVEQQPANGPIFSTVPADNSELYLNLSCHQPETSTQRLQPTTSHWQPKTEHGSTFNQHTDLSHLQHFQSSSSTHLSMQSDQFCMHQSFSNDSLPLQPSAAAGFVQQTQPAVEAGWCNLGGRGGSNPAQKVAGVSQQHLHEISNGCFGYKTAASNPAAAVPHLVGRWCGPYAVIDSASTGSPVPENCMAGTEDLQCDEDMDTTDFNEPQQFLQNSGKSHGSSYQVCLQLSPAATLSDAADWCEHSDGVTCMHDVHTDFDEAAVKSCAQHSKQLKPVQHAANLPGTKAAEYLSRDQHVPANQQSESILQLLNNTACMRKQEQVLTASAAHVRACGAESVRTRLLITELSLYMPHATSSRLALDQANHLMSSMVLPGESKDTSNIQAHCSLKAM
jgi:hypothetical protein